MIINNLLYKKINNINNNNDYSILTELFNPFYSNIFIPGESNITEWKY